MRFNTFFKSLSIVVLLILILFPSKIHSLEIPLKPENRIYDELHVLSDSTIHKIVKYNHQDDNSSKTHINVCIVDSLKQYTYVNHTLSATSYDTIDRFARSIKDDWDLGVSKRLNGRRNWQNRYETVNEFEILIVISYKEKQCKLLATSDTDKYELSNDELSALLTDDIQDHLNSRDIDYVINKLSSSIMKQLDDDVPGGSDLKIPIYTRILQWLVFFIVCIVPIIIAIKSNIKYSRNSAK